MHLWMLMPPVAFTLMVLVLWALAAALKMLAPKGTAKREGTCKAYGCGEDVELHRMQPDYGHFFPFAFFFTVMHVVALILATVPHNLTTAFLPLLYVAAAATALLILFKRRDH